MLDIIYVRKYLAGSQKELQKAINMFSHMDPYIKGPKLKRTQLLALAMRPDPCLHREDVVDLAS